MSALTPDLTLTFRGLHLREELVFKSILRLVTSKTLHHWRYEATTPVDLCILGHHHVEDGLPEGGFADRARAVLHLDPPGPHESQHLYTPLRANEIIRHLDAFGERLYGMTEAQAPTSSRPTSVTDEFVETVQSEEIAKSAEYPKYVLLRWPQTAWLMGDLRRLKLATVLTGTPRSLGSAAQRSGLPETLCDALLSEMRQAGLLQEFGSVGNHDPVVEGNPESPSNSYLDAWGLPAQTAVLVPKNHSMPSAPARVATSTSSSVAEDAKGASGEGIVDRIRRRLKLGLFSVSLA